MRTILLLANESRPWKCAMDISRVLIFATILVGFSPVQAQTSRDIVSPGQSKILLSNVDGPLEQPAATLGNVEVKANAADPKKFDLIYTAPANSAGKSAVVQYTLNGATTKSITLDIVAYDGVWGDAYGPAFKVLFALFVVATLLEWALALLFNWRVFIRAFDARGAKTVFSFLGALWLVVALDLDVIERIVKYLWNPDVKSDWMTTTLSAMVLAGGSSGVNNLLIALGFRSVRTTDTVQPKPPSTKAWLAVHLTRSQVAAGPVTLQLRTATGRFLSLSKFNGTDRRPPFLKWLLRDPLRFPAWGGLALSPDVEYSIKLIGKDSSGEDVEKVEGPIALSAGAIYDVEVTL